MGAKGSKIESQQINNFPKNLLIQLAFPKISQRFQKAQFFYKTKQMKIHLPVDNQSVLKKWQEDIKMVEDEQMKKYLLLPKQYIFNKQGFCGSSGVAQILYDYFPYSLEGQIENRKKSIDNQEFSEPELWKILFTLLKSSHSMHANWKKVGDIRPKNIFYNQDKQLRVSCQCSYPRELTNYEKFIFQRQATYLSPQQIQDIRMGRIQQEKSRNSKQHIIQSESWSIGLTLLNVSLLFNFQKIYDVQKYEINLELVRQKLSDLEQNMKLSLAIKNVIKGMLEQFPERRLLCSQLLNYHLGPYADDILNLRTFETRKLNANITELMEKKAANSLIGTIWSACKAGFIQSLVINNVKNNQSQSRAKEALNEELQKFSQIPPKNSQVSMRDSIRLGGLGGSRGKASNFNESFHTVKSKQSYTLANKISNYSLENRFGGNRIPTAGQHVSPQKSSRYQINSDKFMTPLNTSNFQTIHGNQRSFDFSNLEPISSRFQTSQAIQLPIKDQSQTVRMEGNFKKEKGKAKK